MLVGSIRGVAVDRSSPAIQHLMGIDVVRGALYAVPAVIAILRLIVCELLRAEFRPAAYRRRTDIFGKHINTPRVGIDEFHAIPCLAVISGGHAVDLAGAIIIAVPHLGIVGKRDPADRVGRAEGCIGKRNGAPRPVPHGGQALRARVVAQRRQSLRRARAAVLPRNGHELRRSVIVIVQDVAVGIILPLQITVSEEFPVAVVVGHGEIRA